MIGSIIISIVVPSYKPGDYLFECLQSIDAQTISKERFEVIIVLNGCDEPYRERITNYIQKNNTVNYQLIQTDTPGVSNARNIGIDNAKGDYLAFIDDDDVISPNYLNDLLKVSSPSCIGCSNSYAFTSNINELEDNFITYAFNRCKTMSYSINNFRSFLSPPWCKLIHKDIIGVNRFSTKLKKGEDGLFCFALSANLKLMMLTNDDVIYYQRLRSGSAMRKKNSVYDELREAFRQELVLFSCWRKTPFKYNLMFTLSRAIGIIRNLYAYLR